MLEVSFSTPSISNFTVAVDETISPLKTPKPFNFIGVSRAEANSVKAIAFKSSSVTHLPLSPKDLICEKTFSN